MRQMAMASPAAPPFVPFAESRRVEAPIQRPVNAPEQSKLHPSLAGLKGTQKVNVQVWVVERTPANLAVLKQLGFELMAAGATQPKLYAGRIAADKLAQLAVLTFVTYIAPAR
jgi:hypothetical protein